VSWKTGLIAEVRVAANGNSRFFPSLGSGKSIMERLISNYFIITSLQTMTLYGERQYYGSPEVSRLDYKLSLSFFPFSAFSNDLYELVINLAWPHLDVSQKIVIHQKANSLRKIGNCYTYLW